MQWHIIPSFIFGNELVTTAAFDERMCGLLVSKFDEGKALR